MTDEHPSPAQDPPAQEPEGDLTHLRQVVNPDGLARTESHMVDVSGKPITARMALARARVTFPTPQQRDQVLAAGGPKGPITEVARAAGLLAAKRTGDLIPMCHPLGLDHVELTLEPIGEASLELRCRAITSGRTGVEMEAMTGAAVAALTVYDMVKGLDKGVRIEAVELLEKSGGKSGHWIRATDPD